MKSLQPELQARQQAFLYRRRRVSEGPQRPESRLDGRNLLTFCSNDYLGLANHPEVIKALQKGAEKYGVGSGAAHLVNGHSSAHHALEEELAEFTGRSRALLFSTGYMANQGAITALLSRGDTIYEDRLNHASLIDGGLLSRANFKRFAHGDATALEQQLAKHEKGEALVAVDGVFSMDGDIAPLDEMATSCASHGAWLMVDDAHSFGVLGDKGQGSAGHFNLDETALPLLMGTLGKAIGTFGAFVAGSDDLIETLIQQARSYIFTTAMPPAVAEATRASLRLVQTESWRREHLADLILQFRRGAEQLGLPIMPSQTPIQPIIAGSSEQALTWSQQLEAEGLLVSAIRPPTVPEGSARLRVTLSAQHTSEQVNQLLSGLEKLK